MSTKTKAPRIEESWLKVLGDEFEKEYFQEIKAFLKNEKEKEKVIYPPGRNIFAAFDRCPFDKLKVVILGQDPYHGPGQANGLCFSVNPGIQKPPSLENIFKELNQDTGKTIPQDGDLSGWAEQGVLLLNTSLTVRKGEAGSHSSIGWQHFTNRVISVISENKECVVFLLWGKHAKEKAELIDERKHFILSAAHPSPFSVHNGFFGCRHFSKTNEILKSTGQKPVKW